MRDGQYARVYFSIWTDERFVEIVKDDALLGGWLRLLLLAEAAWPSSPAIPRSLPEETLTVLSGAGVIELHPADTYRIHGLDPERERRSAHGRDAAQRRWDAQSNARSIAPGNAQSMLARSNAHPMLAPRSRSIENERDGIEERSTGESGGTAYETAKAIAQELRLKG